MTTIVQIDGHELSLTLANGLLTISTVGKAGPVPRGGIYLGPLEPEPEPTFIEPDPVAPQPD
ncbi:hypothetical protein [Nocardia arthritidis]|uniref:Uncharacterized protein n=1 Tax=Nocardia arthritidis TaxID=228602 RepID=A0A6G9YTP8_9NOCA|nr:hypothetical protein [Nocardia arthritidis]QIS16588.1 hypothetical protein F5544_43925 [Nocardia arthritidis]